MLKKSLAALAVASFVMPLQAAQIKDVTLKQVGRYATGEYDDGAAEIVAYDPATARMFVINASANTIDILDLSQPSDPSPRCVIYVTELETMDDDI